MLEAEDQGRLINSSSGVLPRHASRSASERGEEGGLRSGCFVRDLCVAMNERIWSWFSCGAASAVAAKKAIELYGDLVQPVYCNTLATEHPDNRRFKRDCEKWLGKGIAVISSEDYTDVDEVFERTKYMSGVKGARCTTEMKKVPRFKLCAPDDIHIFGFTADKKELKRISDFEQRNPELNLRWPLRDLGITKVDCFKILTEAGIDLPAMYKLGYRNNNCLGCVKSSSPGYWSKIRKDFPEVFKRRCEQSRKLGVRLIEIKHHVRIFLDELPSGDFPYKGENISCGPECGSSK